LLRYELKCWNLERNRENRAPLEYEGALKLEGTEFKITLEKPYILRVSSGK
jgi:hypothetical protein